MKMTPDSIDVSRILCIIRKAIMFIEFGSQVAEAMDRLEESVIDSW